MADRHETTSLFEEEAPPASEPLAARMRPRALEEFVGQDAILGPGKILRRMIERDELRSAIFHGPPGCGKSTLAALIARRTQAHFVTFSAVTSGVADVRKAIEAARQRRKGPDGRRTILFVDEIHRFNRAQQDAFLPHVEDGTIVLIGATTENPFFALNGPLLSRSRLFRFEPLADEDVQVLLRRALADPERGLGALQVTLEPEAERHLVESADGDARFALNALEWAAVAAEPDPVSEDAERPVAEAPGRESSKSKSRSKSKSTSRSDRTLTLTPTLTRERSDLSPRRIDRSLAEEAVQRRILGYDREGDNHYDAISAFIKSMRGSDPDAAVYWLARMVQAGEDPRFIARRLVIHAAEDIGMADPQALVVATAAAHAVELVGLPEAQIPMTQAALYIATAPKSNAVVTAMHRANDDVQRRRPAAVPTHLRDSSYPGAKRLGHGKGYLYPHDHPGAHVEQTYLPEGAASGPYYEPTDRGYEATIQERLRQWKGEPEK